jgi:hypothetical protein
VPVSDEGDRLSAFVAQLVANHDEAVEGRAGVVVRLRQERAHRAVVGQYAEMAEVDRRTAQRAVSRLHRQLMTIDDRVMGVIARDRLDGAALALTRRSLGAHDDPVVEEAEVVYARIEELRRQFPVSWSWKRARGTAPPDSELHALEAQLDLLETEYAAIWTRWAAY